MTINDFMDKTKVTISNDLINYIIDGFLKSNLSFYKPNDSLMLYLETDNSSRGKVSDSQTNNFINRLMLDKLKNKYGKDNYLSISEDVRLKDSKEEIKHIDSMFKKSIFVNITKDGLEDASDLRYDHTFIIRPRIDEYSDVLSSLYESVRDLGLDDVLIHACSPNYVGLGYTSPIKINCSVESLVEVLHMLDGMKYNFTSKMAKVLPIFNRFNTWYGYDQYDAYNGVEASAIFTMAIFQAIDKTFDVYLEQDVMINDVNVKEYYDSKPNKLIAMRDIIKNSIALEDALVSNIILNTRNELSAFGLNVTNILNVPAVEARMNEYYGNSLVNPSDEASLIVSEMTLESEEEDFSQVIPVTTNIVMESDVNQELVKPKVEFMTREQIKDETLVASIQDEITSSVEEVISQMRQASNNLKIKDVEAYEASQEEVDEIASLQAKEEKIDKTKKQYQELDQELVDDNQTVGKSEVKPLNHVGDDAYFVNASYLVKYARDFSNSIAEKVDLTDEEVEALKNTSVAELSESINRLVDAIKSEEGYTDTPVEETVVADERLEKYAYLVDDLTNLYKKVKNSDKTVLDYFEEEEVDKNIRGDEILHFHDNSKKTSKQFVNDHLINYLVNFGSHELAYIVALYADSVETPEVIKK